MVDVYAFKYKISQADFISEMTPEEYEKLAFIVVKCLYKYVRMSLGVKNAPSAFQHECIMFFK